MAEGSEPLTGNFTPGLPVNLLKTMLLVVYSLYMTIECNKVAHLFVPEALPDVSYTSDAHVRWNDILNPI